MCGGAWSPDQYERFKDERSRPFYDLLSLVRPHAGMRVVDLGCGTGELTRELHRALGARETVGVDSAEPSSRRAPPSRARGSGSSVHASKRGCRKSPWISRVLERGAALGRGPSQPAPASRRDAWPRRTIAVQVPSNDNHPSHAVAAEVARESPYREALAGYVRVSPNLTLGEYATALDRLGFREPLVRMQVYAHRLGSRTTSSSG